MRHNRLSRWFDDSETESTIPVRAIIAVLFTVGIIAGFFVGKLSSEAFQNLALLALTWYFAKRNIMDYVTNKEPRKGPPSEVVPEDFPKDTPDTPTTPDTPKSTSAYTPTGIK